MGNENRWNPLTMIPGAVNNFLGLATMGIQNRINESSQRRMAELNDARQWAMYQRQMGLSQGMAKEMTDYNLQKQLELWEKTGYSAQMEQLRKAGLNPGLIYGMGGGGGQSTNLAASSPQGAQSIAAAHGVQGMGLDFVKTQAEIRLMEAQAKKAEAEATKTGGVDTDLAKVTIKNLEAGIKNTEADTELKGLYKEIQALDLKFNKDTFEYRVSTANYIASKLNEEISILETQKKLDRDTAETKKLLLGAELQLKYAETALAVAKTNSEKQAVVESIERITKMQKDVLQKWGELSLEQQRNEMMRIQQEWERSGLPKPLKDLLGSVHGVFGFGGGK